MYLNFKEVTFRYETGIEPVFKNVSLHFHQGWSGIVGQNGSGKSTLMKLAAGILEPQKGEIHPVYDCIYCPQRTDDPPFDIESFLTDECASACRIRGLLHIRSEWGKRWGTLSHGERKRIQIGTALWKEPLILAVDEPANHLDLDARLHLENALTAFRGVGLIVSHDRELLDSLCYQCVFINPPFAVMRPGGVSQGLEQEHREIQNQTKQYRQAKKEVKRIRRETIRRREMADQQHKRRSKRGLALRDHDSRAKKDLARVSGKDGTGGKLLRQMDGRMKQAQAKLEYIRIPKTYAHGIWIEGSFSHRAALFHFPAGCIFFGDGRSLKNPDLVMQPRDRIALTGPNGSGKSTLIEKIIGQLSIPQNRLVFVPQEISKEASMTLMEKIRAESQDKLGQIMTIVSRLGSRPERLLQSETPSPGEVRKLILALGIAHEPHLIVMDEPTNHLDLIAIECLESALKECPCGLLLVSHDRRFLKSLTDVNWLIERVDSGECSFELISN
jgi:ATPase subunit of ABC transporter with duplicated ATPase domains